MTTGQTSVTDDLLMAPIMSDTWLIEVKTFAIAVSDEQAQAIKTGIARGDVRCRRIFDAAVERAEAVMRRQIELMGGPDYDIVERGWLFQLQGEPQKIGVRFEIVVGRGMAPADVGGLLEITWSGDRWRTWHRMLDLAHMRDMRAQVDSARPYDNGGVALGSATKWTPTAFDLSVGIVEDPDAVRERVQDSLPPPVPSDTAEALQDAAPGVGASVPADVQTELAAAIRTGLDMIASFGSEDSLAAAMMTTEDTERTPADIPRIGSPDPELAAHNERIRAEHFGEEVPRCTAVSSDLDCCILHAGHLGLHVSDDNDATVWAAP